MSAIILAVLQMLVLLLRAHFNRNDDHEKAMKAIRKAQAKLAEVAEAFETKVRYSSPNIETISIVQDSMDVERKINEPPHN